MSIWLPKRNKGGSWSMFSATVSLPLIWVFGVLSALLLILLIERISDL